MKIIEKIRESGLKQNFIATKMGLSNSHFNQMLKGKATMPEEVRNKLNELLNKILA